MSASLAYAVAALVCYGVSDFLYKQAAAAGIRADHFLMAQAWVLCPLFILYALATRTLVLAWPALWGALAGVFVYVGLVAFTRSLATGPVSTNASIFRMNFVVTVMLAIALLGEPLTAGKAAGLALAVLATWLLVGGGGAAARGPHPGAALLVPHASVRRARHPSPTSRRGGNVRGRYTPSGNRLVDTPGNRPLVQIAVATLAFGASNFVHTVGLRQGAVPETLAVTQGIVFMPLVTLTAYVADRRLRPPRETFKYSIATAIALLAATILLLHSVAGGPASVLVPITQMGFIVAAVLGIVVLRERVTVRKALGLAAALAALGALAGSG